ncbi:hypothetical protein ALO_13857 [Acetonema longum DSM 6540]|uniref:Uncharacterized protein n=1 Tax=Acetonema longum DSM 6540 TaxID=1009370 RepID=F7NKZ9_9FIRM|nr:hypothetical protein ALO_13857 [Acetonema longum DSM 6540]
MKLMHNKITKPGFTVKSGESSLNGEIVSQVAGYGRISSMEIEGVIGDYIKDATCICTDAGKNFITYAKEKELEHYVLNVRRGESVKGSSCRISR